MKTLALFLVCAASIFAAEPDKTSLEMPLEVTLTSGRVLRNVQVLRWESNRVVLKYSGGADPIAFSLFKVPAPTELPAIRTAFETTLAATKKVETYRQKPEKAKKEEEAQLNAGRDYGDWKATNDARVEYREKINHDGSTFRVQFRCPKSEGSTVKFGAIIVVSHHEPKTVSVRHATEVINVEVPGSDTDVVESVTIKYFRAFFHLG